jgi:hypothetical protein
MNDYIRKPFELIAGLRLDEYNIACGILKIKYGDKAKFIRMLRTEYTLLKHYKTF